MWNIVTSYSIIICIQQQCTLCSSTGGRSHTQSHLAPLFDTASFVHYHDMMLLPEVAFIQATTLLVCIIFTAYHVMIDIMVNIVLLLSAANESSLS